MSFNIRITGNIFRVLRIHAKLFSNFQTYATDTLYVNTCVVTQRTFVNSDSLGSHPAVLDKIY